MFPGGTGQWRGHGAGVARAFPVPPGRWSEGTGVDCNVRTHALVQPAAPPVPVAAAPPAAAVQSVHAAAWAPGPSLLVKG
eukprot:gene18487-biopygen17410